MEKSTIAHADKIMDYLPLVSTVSNGAELITKVVLSILSVVTPETYKDLKKSHMIQHIERKSVIASLFMMIPGVNMVSALAHHHNDHDGKSPSWFLTKLITRIDVVMDFIPGVSLYNNVACLVAKVALFFFQCVAPDTFKWAKERSHFIRHLDNKHAAVCAIMTVPILNIIIASLYHSRDKAGKEEFNRTTLDILTIHAIFRCFQILLSGRR